MLPKPHNDNTSWSNYRSISFVNLDIKILAKILSSRARGLACSVNGSKKEELRFTLGSYGLNGNAVLL